MGKSTDKKKRAKSKAKAGKKEKPIKPLHLDPDAYCQQFIERWEQQTFLGMELHNPIWKHDPKIPNFLDSYSFLELYRLYRLCTDIFLAIRCLPDPTYEKRAPTKRKVQEIFAPLLGAFPELDTLFSIRDMEKRVWIAFKKTSCSSGANITNTVPQLDRLNDEGEFCA